MTGSAGWRVEYTHSFSTVWSVDILKFWTIYVGAKMRNSWWVTNDSYDDTACPFATWSLTCYLYLPLRVTDVMHPAKIIVASPTFIASLSQTYAWWFPLPKWALHYSRWPMGTHITSLDYTINSFCTYSFGFSCTPSPVEPAAQLGWVSMVETVHRRRLACDTNDKQGHLHAGSVATQCMRHSYRVEDCWVQWRNKGCGFNGDMCYSNWKTLSSCSWS